MYGQWGDVLMIIIVIGCTVGMRVLMELFCVHTERKTRLLCVAGIMVLYTIVVTWELFFIGELLVDGTLFMGQEQISVTDYRNIICVLFPITNLLLGGLILFYSATIKKRVLSSREKIMLKDM